MSRKMHDVESSPRAVRPISYLSRCRRRNFQKEIAEGTVIVVPEGGWNETSTMDFDIGANNSLIGTFVRIQPDAQKIKVLVRPLGEMLRIAVIDRVDFLKMNIEGAERQALKGTVGVLGKWKPRLMLDSSISPTIPWYCRR